MAMKKRAKIVLWVLGIFLALGILLALAGWRFYKVYRNPERFLGAARSLTAEGEYEAAMDQYRRALRYTRENVGRADILREMAEAIQARSPLPVEEAFEAYRSVLGLWAGICRNDRDDEEVRTQLLDSQFRVVRQADVEWAWRGLQEVADMIQRIDGDNLQAEKYQAIARLKLDDGETEEAVFYEEINSTLQEIWDLTPDDRELPYYLSVCNLAQASTIKGSYMPLRGRALIERAIERMDDFVEQHSQDLEARIARLRIMAQGAWLLREFDLLPMMREEITDLEAQVKEVEPDPETAMELAHLVLLTEKLQAARGAEEAGLDIPAADQATALARAEAILLDAHERDPNNIRLLLRIAINLREGARRAEALEWLDRVLAPHEIPVDSDAIGAWNARLHARFLVADLLLQQYEAVGDDDERREIISRVRAHIRELEDVVDADSPYLQLLEGRLAYHNGNYREAVQKLTDAQERLGRRTPEAALFSGLGLARLGETGAAVRRLAEFLSTPGATQEHRERAWLEMASSAIQLRDFDQAVKIARRLLERNPEDQETNLLLGRALVLQLLTGRVTNREDVFQEVIALLEPLAKKGNSQALRQLAEVYELADDWPAAKKLLVDYCQDHSDDAAALVQLYHGLRRAGEEDEAKEWIRKVLSSLPESEAGERVRRALDGDALMARNLNVLLSIALTEDTVDQHLQLADFYRQVGRSDDADRVLAEAGTLAPDDPRVLGANFDRALQQGQMTRANQLLAEYKQTDPSDVDVNIWQAQIHLAAEEYSRAIDVLDAAVSADPNRSDLYRLRGEAYRLNGDLFKAEENFRQALELRPNQPFSLRRLIQVSAARGLHHQALKYMRRALAFTPADEQLMGVFLDYLSEHGSTDEALEIRLRLASVRPNDHANRRAIAELYVRSRQLDKARGVLAKLLQDAPDDFANVVSMAWFEARSGEPEKGTERLRQFLNTHDDTVGDTEYLQFAEYLRRIGQNEEAETAARKAVVRDKSESMQATQYLGELQLEGGRPDEALETFRGLLAEKPVPTARLGVARCLIELRRPQEALGEINQLEAAGENLPALYRLKAEALAGLSRFEDAYKAADNAIQGDPQDARSYFLRAQARFNDRDGQRQKQVLSDLEKALELSSRMPQARLLLTEWFARNNRLDEAVTEARRLVDRYPNVPDFRRNLAQLYLNGRMYDRLEQHLADWAEDMPESLLITQYRARLAEARGDLAKAVDEWRTVVEDTPTNDALYRYLSVLLKAGRAAWAVDMVESNDDAIPAEPQFLALYARALLLTDQTEKGRGVFRRALAAAEGNPRLLQEVIRQAREVLGPDELLPLLAQTASEDGSGIVSLVMGQLRLRKGELRAGIRELEALQRELPEDSPIRGQLLTTLGTAYSQLGENKRAEQTYRAALQAMPDDPVVLNNLAYAMAAAGSDPYEAVKLARRAVDSGGHSEDAMAYYLDTLGFAQYKADLLFHARENLQRSVNLGAMPANTYHLGLVLLAENRPLEAKEMLLQASRLAEEVGDTEYSGGIKEALVKAEEQAARMPQTPEDGGDDDQGAPPEPEDQ